MKQILSREDDSNSCRLEIPPPPFVQKVGLLLDPILSELNPVDATRPIYLQCIFNIITSVSSYSKSFSFRQNFQLKFCVCLLFL